MLYAAEEIRVLIQLGGSVFPSWVRLEQVEEQARRGSGTPTRITNGAGSTGRIHSDPYSKMPSIAACINVCGNLIAVALRQGAKCGVEVSLQLSSYLCP